MNNFIMGYIQKEYIIPYWMESMELPADFNVLHIGAGRGVTSAHLYDKMRPWRLDAFDSDEYTIEHAKNYLGDEYEGKIFLKQCKFSALDVVDEKYDIVVDFFNMHHTKNWRKGISEISRVLKPNGYFAFAELYESNLKEKVTKNLLKLKSKIKMDRNEFIKELAENRLRLFEKNHRLWGRGIIGIAKKTG